MGIDSRALLDYALFQLTPTRTRCDLVVFSGGINEKLASGLVEPFISHMKFFKDQIPKGGYSITLQPPKSGSYWFTKSTIQRFVRFVSTPEVLERFARLEKEISQIESSVQPNEIATSNGLGHGDEGNLPVADGVPKPSPRSSKKGQANGSDDDVKEENSKVRLQRVLESRKALLRKEQAMAYARALVAGYELENIDSLILFADAFGASRLREACTDFKELCKKKHTDGVWLDELAAMQASGMIIAPESNPNLLQFPTNGKLTPNGSMDLSSESAGSQDNGLPASDQHPTQVQMQWPNQVPPQYMFNPYQAYPFPYYPGNMPWPQNMDEASRGLARHQRTSSRKKDKSSASEEPGTSEEDEETESGDSDTGADLDHEKKKSPKEKANKKKHQKSSKTVVIRNINYITSKRRDDEYSDSSSVEDGDSIRQQVEDAVGSLGKHHKSSSNRKKRGEEKIQIFENESYNSADQDTGNDVSGGGKQNGTWDAFQNLLMRENESDDNKEQFQQHRDVMDGEFTKSSGHMNSETVQRRQTVGMDSFIVNGRNEVNEGRFGPDDFGNPQTFRPNMKRRDCPEEALLFPQRSAEYGSNAVSDFGANSSIIRNGKGEDWFVANHSDASTNGGAIFDQRLLSGGYAKPSEENRPKEEQTKKAAPIDDSFMVQTSYDNQYDSQWKTDISMVSDLIGAEKPENGSSDAAQNKKADSYEPDDLCVMLSRESEDIPVGASWSSDQMDFSVEASFTEAMRKPSVVETTDQVEEKVSANGKKNAGPGKNPPGKQVRSKSLPGSLSKTKPGVVPKSQKPFTSRPLVQKSKAEKEEEARRKIEELALERQKRIAERSAASGGKKVPIASPKSASPKSAPLKKTTAKA